MGVSVTSDEVSAYLDRLTPTAVGAVLGRARPRLGELAAAGSRAAYQGSVFPTSKTGNLFRSIDWRPMKSRDVIGFVAGPMQDRGALGYHRYLVEGGTNPHFTYPVKRVALRWVDRQGNVRFSRGFVPHPGAKANPWMTRSKPRIVSLLVKEFELIVKKELT